jgi:hypothetical protein
VAHRIAGILMRSLGEDQAMRLLDRRFVDKNRPCSERGAT